MYFTAFKTLFRAGARNNEIANSKKKLNVTIDTKI